MASLTSLYLWSLAGSLLVMTIAFLYALSKKRVDAVDGFWAMAILASVICGVLASRPIEFHGLVVVGLVGIWALRLSHHIAKRFDASSRQDKRYTELMAGWPRRAVSVQVFFRIFLLQAVLASVVGWAATVAASQHVMYEYVFALGVVVWMLGFLFEHIADGELADFLRDPRNKGTVMSRGLWQHSRHPNYFGELLVWWGVWILAASTGNMWIALISPVLITVLLVFVSGIPPAERQASKRRGWDEYARTTNKLIPGPRKI